MGLTGDGKGQERPQLVFCSKAGDKNWGIIYGETEREEKNLQAAYLVFWQERSMY